MTGWIVQIDVVFVSLHSFTQCSFFNKKPYVRTDQNDICPIPAELVIIRMASYQSGHQTIIFMKVYLSIIGRSFFCIWLFVLVLFSTVWNWLQRPMDMFEVWRRILEASKSEIKESIKKCIKNDKKLHLNFFNWKNKINSSQLDRRIG